MKIAFLFSGQGAQYPGMGKDLCDHFPKAKEIYDAASSAFGYDVLELSQNGSDAELSRTAVSQPLIYTLSMAAFAVISEKGIRAEAVAGFSLGECSALTASGAVNPATGFQVIRSRAQAMQKAANESKSAMFAIIGAQADAIEDACKNAGGYVVPVNYNSPGQIVIAGEEEAAQAAAKILSDTGIRVVRLAVNAAFHSRLMENASKCFHAEIKDFSFSKPAVDFYSNITGDRTLIDDIPEYLKKQMTSPVLFSNEMSSMFRDGIDTFIELGPGKTLCGFIRKGLKGVRAFNVEDVKSLEKCLNALDK